MQAACHTCGLMLSIIHLRVSPRWHSLIQSSGSRGTTPRVECSLFKLAIPWPARPFARPCQLMNPIDRIRPRLA